MKQTKPYGRAYLPAAEAALAAAESPAPPAPAHVPTHEPAPERQVHYRTEYAHPESVATPGVITIHISMTLESLIHKLVALGAIICISLTFFVLIRDSLDTVSALEHVHTADTITECRNGTIEYQGFSISDRIMGRGSFVCTDWHTENRYLHLPRGPHFIDEQG